MSELIHGRFLSQDHDSRVAETAVVGFPHDTFGEGKQQKRVEIYSLRTCSNTTYCECPHDNFEIIICEL